jgi:hypothetical protein
MLKEIRVMVVSGDTITGYAYKPESQSWFDAIDSSNVFIVYANASTSSQHTLIRSSAVIAIQEAQ